MAEDERSSLSPVARQPNSKKRKRSEEQQPSARGPPTTHSSNHSHTRTLAACDACRVSKTRCDAARPVCSKCVKRGRTCVYPDKDPSSIFEVWGTKILNAIENQGLLLSDIARTTRDGSQHQSPHSAHLPPIENDDPETLSRKDVAWTPITGPDKILEWSVFPLEKPARTLPDSAFIAKPNPYALETLEPSSQRMYELRDIFLAKVEPKCPLVDLDQLESYIQNVVENGFGWSVSSCLVLLIYALAAVWGNYPDDERRLVVSNGTREPYTCALPEHRLKEASIYFSMAQRRISTASTDESLLGVLCFSLTGTWHQYNFEPMQAWKAFRTASVLWESYNLRHSLGGTQRSAQEEGLEARMYWSCLKAECEMRYEIPDLPPCILQESRFPFSLPSFPLSDGHSHSPGQMMNMDRSSVTVFTPSSHYYFLAEIALRRLLNRARHAATTLSKTIDSLTATQLADTLHELEDQLQLWLECLPPALRFNVPPDSWPAADEPELVKLMRERYVETRELLYRVFLYICLHGGTRLTHTQAKTYGAKASAGLCLSVYRVQTEKPFFRHAGSWIACRVRFNQALCLLAAVRGKEMGIELASYLVVPPTWRECVGLVRDRLETWSDQGGGVAELALLVNWLLGQS